MAFSRKMLEAMGIEGEKIDQIIEEHVATVEALKSQRDANAAAAADLEKANQRISELEQALSAAEPYKARYENTLEEYETFKETVEAEKERATRQQLYRSLLQESGIADKRIDTVLKVADLDALQIEDGKVTNADDMKAKITEEWADLIPAEAMRGANVDTPPNTSKGGMTKEQIMQIKNPVQRQQAMAENPGEFPELAGLS